MVKAASNSAELTKFLNLVNAYQAAVDGLCYQLTDRVVCFCAHLLSMSHLVMEKNVSQLALLHKSSLLIKLNASLVVQIMSHRKIERSVFFLAG